MYLFLHFYSAFILSSAFKLLKFAFKLTKSKSFLGTSFYLVKYILIFKATKLYYIFLFFNAKKDQIEFWNLHGINDKQFQ